MDDLEAIGLADGFDRVLEDIFNDNGCLGIDLGEPGSRLSAVIGGARLGKFYTYSAPTGEGKTRFLVSNACSISIPRVGKPQDLQRS